MVMPESDIRPLLNKKSFPVHRPGGLKRADWNFFSPYFSPFFFFFSLTLYTLVYKNEIRNKKKKFPSSRLAFFLPTGPTGNNFLLKGGLMSDVYRSNMDICMYHIGHSPPGNLGFYHFYQIKSIPSSYQHLSCLFLFFQKKHLSIKRIESSLKDGWSSWTKRSPRESPWP